MIYSVTRYAIRLAGPGQWVARNSPIHLSDTTKKLKADLMLTRTILSGLLATTLTLVLGACSTEAPIIEPTPTPTTQMPFASSEEILMSNFRWAYEHQDSLAYRDLLDPAFVTVLQPATTQLFPYAGPELTVSEELRIAGRMFRGERLSDPDGTLVPAIAGVSFDLLMQAEPWHISSATDSIPNTRSALFDVVVRVDRTGASTLTIQGQIKFYVTRQDSLHDGVMQSYWRMIGQRDLTDPGPKAIETVAWGEFKARYY